MALQGDLNSFALPEVLRLLAGTGKSGRLDVTGAAGTGALWLNEGTVVDAEVSSAPRAADGADVLYEMLRFDEGSFSFDDSDRTDVVGGSDVESLITAAQALVAEWEGVEKVVPSMGAWVALVGEIEQSSVEISAAQWRVLAAVAGGGTVQDLADVLELGDLDACRSVKDLVDGALVEVRPSHTYEPDVPTVGLDDFSSYEEDIAESATMTDLQDLVGEDRPVVMEDREDALLPEPLPGEGVAYDGEEIIGAVDGFRSEPEPVAPAAADLPDAEAFDPSATQTDEAFAAIAAASTATDAPTYADSFARDLSAGGEPGAEAGSMEAPADSDMTGENDETAAWRSDDPAAAVDAAAAMPEAGRFEGADGGDAIDDEERGSLLRFLSTVKP